MIRQVVEAALWAPSGDNCQPWRYAWDGQRLDVLFDADRAASLYDAGQCASWIALGASLTNMRIAARAVGWAMAVELFPGGPAGSQAAADCVARIRFDRTPQAGDPLASTIRARCSNRKPYRAAPLAADDRATLMGAIDAASGARLTLIEDDQAKRRVAALAARNDRILFENRALHDGLYRWLRWTDAEAQRAGDGFPLDALEVGRAESIGFRAMAAWPVAQALAALGITRLLPERTERIYRRSAAFGLVSVPSSRREDVVRCGEALERLWLVATRRGLAFQPVTGILCLLWRCRMRDADGLSDAHRRLVETSAHELARDMPALTRETPIMLFRLGYAEPPTARTRRRPVDAVLRVALEPATGAGLR